MQFRISAHSHAGPVRKGNEDAVLVDNTHHIYAVADGMGGHPAGELAARMALDTVHRSLRDGSSGPIAPRRIRNAISQACADIHRAAQREPERGGMGCALTMLAIVGQHAVIGHVGHGRAYRVRDGRVEQLTADHTLAGEFQRAGFSPEAASNRAFAHTLTRNVGSQPSVLVDTLVVPLRAGDHYILASNGACVAVDADAPRLLDAAEPAHALVSSAFDRGSQGNASAVVIGVPASFEGDHVRVEELLGGVPALADLSAMGFLLLREAGRRTNVTAGSVIWRACHEVEEMVLVTQGTLRWQGLDSGPRTIKAGEVVGLSTLLAPRRAPADLVAAESSALFVLSSAALRGLVRRRHAFGVGVLLRLGAELTKALELGDGDIAHW